MLHSDVKSTPDQYVFSKEVILLTPREHHIPGLPTWGHHFPKAACSPVGWHYHVNSFEFFFLIKGKTAFVTQEGTHTFSGGELLVIFPNEIHGTNELPIGNCECYWLQVNISDENNFLFLKPDAAKEMIGQLSHITQRIIKMDLDQIHPLLKSAFEISLNGDNPQMAATFLQLILHYIITYARQGSSRMTPDIKRTVDCIHESLTTSVTLEQLAALANLSVAQFKSKFKDQVGFTPRHYINQQKIEYAKQLLLEGRSVTDIAMLLDFTTSTYFSSVFKKYTYYTPMEFVKKEGESRKRRQT